jgi:hypothetical protein
MIKDTYLKIKCQIDDLALKSGRDPLEIIFLAVTKTHPADTVNLALNAGITHFGENKVQEAENKLPLINSNNAVFHFIGHLQSNKINKLLALNPFLIHSIDKLSTAEKLNSCCEKLNRSQNILIEVNTSGEASKEGISPDLLPDLIKKISLLNNLKIKGLMTIGALSEDRSDIRKCFKSLKILSDQIRDLELPNVQMSYLSMGMSGDFDIAIEEGANIVRIGSLLFGQRDYSNQKRSLS